MKRFLLFGLALVLAPPVQGQLPQIRITGVFPPGAQRGSSVDVTVTAGTDLDEASELVTSHPGIKATPKLDGNGKPVVNQFVLSLDPALEAGLYDIRLRGLFGVSNPRVFRVDTIPEIQEAEPNNTNEQAQEVSLNTIVNARSNGGADVDTFKLAVTAGQTIIIRSEAAVLDSLMQPVLEVFDAAGRRVTQTRRRRQQEAVIVYTSPIDQVLLLKVHDIVYAGSNDYGYRLSVDTRSVVDFVQPQVVQVDVDSKVTIFGRHLVGGQPTDMELDGVPLMKKDVTVKFSKPEERTVGTDSSAVSISTAIYAGIDGSLLPFAVRSAAVAAVAEAEVPATAQLLAVPADVTGSFATELDEDSFRFDAKKGEQWQIDVMAHRLGSSADPMLIIEQVVKAADGAETLKRLARVDEDKQNPGGANLPTLTSDPTFLLTAPADGQYQIRLKDRYAASRGAPDLTYGLSIRKPAADFQVVVFDSFPSADGKAPPSSGAISIRKGGTYQVPVYVYRSGGHNADIQLRVEGLPEGITAAEATIRAGAASTLLVLTAAASVGEIVAPVRIIGTSVNGDQKTEHAARIATLVHAGVNGLPRTGRVSSALLVSVMKDEQPFHIQPAVVTADMTQDQQLLIPLKLTRRAGFDAKVDIAFAGQPKNVDVPKIAIEKGTDSAVARFFFKENATVGPATLLMYTTAAVPYSRNPWQVERATAKVTEAAEKLAAEQKVLADSKAAAEAGAKKMAELAAALKTYDGQLKVEQAAQTKAQADLKAAIAGKSEATKQLLALQQTLNAAAADKTPQSQDLDAAIKAVQDATAAVNVAAKPVAALVVKINGVNSQIAQKQKLVAEKSKQIADATKQMAAQQQVVEKAKAGVTAAEASLKTREAEKKAADAAAKKATDAAKPKNINVRTIAIPVRLTVHTTPGKIVAAVPDKGAIKKGAAIDVKVTLTRKNKFAGPVKVALSLPAGTTGVTSNVVEIPADKTEATLSLSAAADAAPADIANAVIRATAADFNGRVANFDAPIALKVTE
ncbi:MAG: hypothetical protein GY758_05895 [Fuerstiella sp.]|nr:hypothetical protein [Fuerstiella sp.]MCP4512506.1 hypothetical protein [Fuerstiella sp.]